MSPIAIWYEDERDRMYAALTTRGTAEEEKWFLEVKNTPLRILPLKPTRIDVKTANGKKVPEASLTASFAY